MVKLQHLFPPVEIQKKIENIGVMHMDEEGTDTNSDSIHIQEWNLSQLQNILFVRKESIPKTLPKYCLIGAHVQNKDNSINGIIKNINGNNCEIITENEQTHTINGNELIPIVPNMDDHAIVFDGENEKFFGKVVGIFKEENVYSLKDEEGNAIMCKLPNLVKFTKI